MTRILDLTLPAIPADYLFPRWDAAAARNCAPWLTAEDMAESGETVGLSIHGWLVRTADCNVLIDTGAGNHKSRPLNPVFDRLDTPWLHNLAAAGIEPAQIDFVIATHLHVDHVGWNTVHDGQRWVPTFPNATYLFSKAEYEFYAHPDNVRPPSAGVFEDSVEPVLQSGRAALISTSDALPIPGFTLHATKGHSFDHLSVSVHRNGETGLFAGDVMHHPVQIGCPEWNSVFCEFPEDALASRRWALSFSAETNALYFSSHFAGSSVGTVERGSQCYRWLPR